MKKKNYGFEAGKGSAYAYLPEWMEIPPLYAVEKSPNPVAVIKLFALGSNWTWYVLESDGETCFGLVVGHETELGYFSLAEMRGIKWGRIPAIERDLSFPPTPVRELQAYRDEWGSGGPYKGGPETGKARPEGWTLADIRYLLAKLEERTPILVADSDLGLATLHDFPGARHCGMGVFQVEVDGATLTFNGGGGMARTPSGKGWCTLGIKGSYPYPFAEARQTLQAYLPEEEPSPTPPFANDPVHPSHQPLGASANGSPDAVWEPNSETRAAYEDFRPFLLTGSLQRGGEGYLALLAVEDPDLLRLALQEDGLDSKRARALQRRLSALQISA